MSGDVTEYARAKAQDRMGPDATFMKDGYARWAESEAPLRVGGAMKMGDESHGGRKMSSKHLQKYLKDQKIHGGAGLGKPHKNPFHEPRSRHRRRRPASRSVSSSSDSSSDSSDSSDSGSSSGSGSSCSSDSSDEDMKGRGPPRVLYKKSGGRRRSPSSSSCSSSSSDSSMERPVGGRKGMRGRRRSSSSSSDSSDSSSSSGGGFSMTEKNKQEARKFVEEHERLKLVPLRNLKRGGDGKAIKHAIDTAFNIWYNTKIAGKALANWSTIPSGVKSIVNNINSIWTTLEKNAPAIKSALKTVKLDKVIGLMEKVGLGKHGMGRKQRAKIHAHFLHKMLKGGDAFDDKLSSMNLLTLYNLAKGAIPKDKKATFSKFENGVRGAYNVYSGLKNSASAIEAVKDQLPPGVKEQLEKVVSLVKGSGKQEDAEDLVNKTMAAMKGQGKQEDSMKTMADDAAEAVKKTEAAAMKVEQKMNAPKVEGKGRKGKRKPSERNMMVSKLMREEGLSLGEASKKVSAMMKKK
jgi:hypothetical protein